MSGHMEFRENRKLQVQSGMWAATALAQQNQTLRSCSVGGDTIVTAGIKLATPHVLRESLQESFRLNSLVWA